MRIAIISDLSAFAWAGSEELWAALAARALEEGHQVGLYLTRLEIPEQKIDRLLRLGLEFEPARWWGARGLELVRERVSWKLASVLARQWSPLARIRHFAPDVVFFSCGQAPPDSLYLKEWQRIGVTRFPYVVVSHSAHLLGVPRSEHHRKIAAEFFGRASAVLFTSEKVRQDTEHLMSARIARHRIVRDPFNLTDTSPMPMPAWGTIRLASVGRLQIPSKGQDLLLAALGSPEFQARDWRLSIYGSGPHGAYLKDLARHYGIADRVEFRGQVNDVRAIWAEQHMLVLPSRNESAPLVVKEAMLCGRPCLATDVGLVSKWVTEPETGFIAESAEIPCLRSALERAWQAIPEWAAMGARAHEKAMGLVDPDPGGAVLRILEEVRAQQSG